MSKCAFLGLNTLFSDFSVISVKFYRLRISLLSVFVVVSLQLNSQYYLKGQVTDDKGRQLSGVKLQIKSKLPYLFYTGSNGSFGVPISSATDSLTIVQDSYLPLHTTVNALLFNQIVLITDTNHLKKQIRRLSSITKNVLSTRENLYKSMGESYSSLIDHSFVDATKYPETGFTLNTDKASYSNIRRFLKKNMRVPSDAVRIEEMLNYFDFPFFKPQKDSNKIFRVNTQITDCPWNPQSRLLHIHVKAPSLDLDSIPPTNLVFLIDISGSMDRDNRLPLLQQSFRMLVECLRSRDTVSIVTYGGGVAIVLNGASGDEKERIMKVIDSLEASGSTPGEGAIKTAYNLAVQRFLKGGNNRVILATDGDFNVGQQSDDELENMIAHYKETGIYLTCLGVGMGNYKDSKLEGLAKRGNGNFAYIDHLDEAYNSLVKEFSKTLYSVAENALLNIRFNDEFVSSYKLVGYNNRKDAIEDSTSILEGRILGTGHNLTAMVELNLKKNPSVEKSLGVLELQYSLPGIPAIHSKNVAIPYNEKQIKECDALYSVAAAVAWMGQLLRASEAQKTPAFEEIKKWVSASISTSKSEVELIQLLDLAHEIYFPTIKKRKKD